MQLELYDFCPDNCPFIDTQRVATGYTRMGEYEGIRIECSHQAMCRYLHDEWRIHKTIREKVFLEKSNEKE